MTRLLVTFACLLSACGSGESTSAAEPQVEARPDPTACETVEDCVYAPAVAESNECCDTGFASAHYARDYVAWREAWLPEHCEPAERAGGARCTCCPVPDGHGPAAPPPPCYAEPRCVDGRCTGGCGP